MSGPNLYSVLGVSHDATDEQLRSAYRRRSRLTHPDQGGDAVAFRAVESAFRILSDPGLRAGYDAELGLGNGWPPHAEPPPRDPGPRSQPMVDFGQIQWAAAFVDADGTAIVDPRTARVVPGRLRWLWRPASWVLIGAWAWGAWWLGANRSTPFEFAHLAWMAAWAVTSTIVIVQGARGRWSVLIIAAAWLGWPAYVAAEDLWTWILFAWLALAVAAPPFRSWVGRPMWSTRAALAGNIIGNPAWHRTRTAAVVEQLTVIPGVRVLHRVANAEHAVILDRKVALIGGAEMPAIGRYPARSWPTAVEEDPQRAVDEIGRWLLEGSDPTVVDRRALAAVAGTPSL